MSKKQQPDHGITNKACDALGCPAPHSSHHMCYLENKKPKIPRLGVKPAKDLHAQTHMPTHLSCQEPSKVTKQMCVVHRWLRVTGGERHEDSRNGVPQNLQTSSSIKMHYRRWQPLQRLAEACPACPFQLLSHPSPLTYAHPGQGLCLVFLTLDELYHNACALERGAAESTPVHEVCREPDVFVHITAVSLWLSLEDPEELLEALLRAMNRTANQQVGRKP